MNYNFDEIIDRHHTDAVKTDWCEKLFGTDKVLPLWVADMDFRTPDCILNAIRKRLEHPILGYTKTSDNFIPITIKWIRDHHNWEVESTWIGFQAGIVPGISFALQTFSSPGDEVIVQPPVYFPFMTVTEKNNRKLIFNPLRKTLGKFEMDFDDLENKITPKTRILILCNPHNPGGRIWNKATLSKLADICAKNNILVISDEIHADMALPGHIHTPFATVSDTAANLSITFMAPSKTFNIPGLISSSYIIPNSTLREKYVRFLEQMELTGGNLFSYIATEAAFTQGENWRKQMLEYVHGNTSYVSEFITKHIPGIKPMLPDASFLMWLDCSGLGFKSSDELFRFFVDKAGIGLNMGTSFGPGGEFHLRLNLACSRLILVKAMEQLKHALSDRK